MDAQYRYTVGLAPLYCAPRKYYLAKKCCYPSRPVPYVRPSVHPASSPSIADARARSRRLSKKRDISERQARQRRARSTMLFFSLALAHPVPSSSLVSDRDSGHGCSGERSRRSEKNIRLLTTVRRRSSRPPAHAAGILALRRGRSVAVIPATAPNFAAADRNRGRRSAVAENPQIRVRP